MNPIREFEYRLTDDTTVKGKFIHQFNILIDNSAVGKTTLLNSLNEGNNSDQLRPLNSTASVEDFSTDNPRICLIDEDDFNALWSRTGIREAIISSKQFYLIITRFTIPNIKIHYEAIFHYHKVNETNIVLTPYAIPTREPSITDMIITEDSGTGLEYYKHWFLQAITSNGKSNLVNKFLDNTNTTLVVADGSAIGLDVLPLLNIGCDLYLPDSFESDIAYRILGKNRPSFINGELGSYESIEDYFDNLDRFMDKDETIFYSKKIPLCDYIYNYDMYKLGEPKGEMRSFKNNSRSLLVSKLKKSVSHMKHKETINLLEDNSEDHYGITENMAKLHNIDWNDLEACQELSKKILKN